MSEAPSFPGKEDKTLNDPWITRNDMKKGCTAMLRTLSNIWWR